MPGLGERYYERYYSFHESMIVANFQLVGGAVEGDPMAC